VLEPEKIDHIVLAEAETGRIETEVEVLDHTQIEEAIVRMEFDHIVTALAEGFVHKVVVHTALVQIARTEGDSSSVVGTRPESVPGRMDYQLVVPSQMVPRLREF
jgi:hypothetical protein